MLLKLIMSALCTKLLKKREKKTVTVPGYLWTIYKNKKKLCRACSFFIQDISNKKIVLLTRCWCVFLVSISLAKKATFKIIFMSILLSCRLNECLLMVQSQYSKK